MSAPAALPFGGNAVMASRVAVAEDRDYFPTPPWAMRAGGELIKRLDPAARTCWEPACGEGHGAHGLADYFDHVRRSDIHDYGRGELVVDFLAEEASGFERLDWIVTNPPFIHGEAFVRAALQRARVGVAMLVRLSFLEGVKRHRLLYVDHPLTVAAPFAERVPMLKGRWDPDASSATAYAWLVWDKHAARLDGVGPPQLLPIAPGAKARLTKPSDLLTFGPLSVAWYLAEADQLEVQAANDNAQAERLRKVAAEHRASARRIHRQVAAISGQLPLLGGA